MKFSSDDTSLIPNEGNDVTTVNPVETDHEVMANTTSTTVVSPWTDLV